MKHLYDNWLSDIEKASNGANFNLFLSFTDRPYCFEIHFNVFCFGSVDVKFFDYKTQSEVGSKVSA